jgi:uncharacterized protein HemX
MKLTPKFYQFAAILLLIFLIIACVFLFSPHRNGKEWKVEKEKLEKENKILDAQIKAYQYLSDSLNGVVNNRYKEIEKKDSIINGLNLNLSKLQKKYEKIYSSLDELNAVGNYQLFSTYTDTIP